MTQKPHTPSSPPAPGGKAPSTKVVDWERIELDYRAGIKTLRELSSEYGPSPATILKRAKRNDWTRDLAAKIQAKADSLVNRELVNSTVNKETGVSERQMVDVIGAVVKEVKLSQHSSIRRNGNIVNRLMDEMELQAGPENAALLADLGEMLRNPDENGQDKLNDLYRRIISLPERAKTAKTLAETLRITIDMERQAFGMDAKGADGAAPGAAGYVPPAIRVVHVTAPARQEDDDAGE